MRSKESSKREWYDKVATWGLLILSVLVIFLQLGDQLARLIPILGFLKLDNASVALPLILSEISLLAFSVGLERYAAIDEAKKESQNRHLEITQAISRTRETVQEYGLNLEKELVEIHRTLSTSIVGKPLMGNNVVYEEAIRLIRTCNGSEIIRATSLGTSSQSDESPEGATPYRTYLETLAKKIGQQKQRKLGMVYKVIIGLQLDVNGVPQLPKQRGIRTRRKFFKEENALDRLEMKYIENSWSLDLLLLGDKHLIIGFPIIAGDTEIRLGIRISDREFVGSVVRWYDECVWNEAKVLTWTGEEAL